MIKTSTGKIVPISGQYKTLKGPFEVTLVKGGRVPPVDGKGATLILVDQTKHKP